MQKRSTPTIRDLYPNLTEEELEQAERNLNDYLLLVLQIFERREIESNSQVGQLTVNSGTVSCTPPAPDTSG